MVQEAEWFKVDQECEKATRSNVNCLLTGSGTLVAVRFWGVSRSSLSRSAYALCRVAVLHAFLTAALPLAPTVRLN
jgi:hypothetical protein